MEVTIWLIRIPIEIKGNRMLSFIFRRFLLSILTIWVLSMLSWVIIELPPGDYIDIYMIDHPGLSDVESDESFEALNRLKEDGKILAWGTSVDYSEGMDEVIEILILFQ